MTAVRNVSINTEPRKIWAIMEWDYDETTVVAAFSKKEYAEEAFRDCKKVRDVWIEEIEVRDSPLKERYLCVYHYQLCVHGRFGNHSYRSYPLTEDEKIEGVSHNGEWVYSASSESKERAIKLAKQKLDEIRKLRKLNNLH